MYLLKSRSNEIVAVLSPQEMAAKEPFILFGDAVSKIMGNLIPWEPLTENHQLQTGIGSRISMSSVVDWEIPTVMGAEKWCLAIRAPWGCAHLPSKHQTESWCFGYDAEKNLLELLPDKPGFITGWPKEIFLFGKEE